VLVTHPGQRNGQTFADGPIGWTERHDFSHYDTVYLWHEILHHFIKPTRPTMDVGNPAHAIIELLSDNELRVRLGGGPYPPFLGHPEDLPFQERLLPQWRTYLRQPRRDVLQFLTQAEAQFPSP
jgi:hypothetical protein